MLSKIHFKYKDIGIHVVAQQFNNQLVSMRMWVWSLASISGLKDPVLPWAVVATDVASILCCYDCDIGQQLQLQFNP